MGTLSQAGRPYNLRVLFIGLILFGMLIGAGAQLLLGRASRGIDWGKALVSGLVGSFVGGLIFSLAAGDGFDLRPSGIIGSLIGATIVSAAWFWFERRG